MTMRWIAALGFTFTVLLAVPFANEAEAARYRHKRCIAPAMFGAQQTTWVCRASERCCYDWVLRKGTCPSARCF